MRDANGVVIAKYYYDGEGKRVKKEVIATGETNVFVYSSGKLVAEYSTQISQTPSVSYLTSDHFAVRLRRRSRGRRRSRVNKKNHAYCSILPAMRLAVLTVLLLAAAPGFAQEKLTPEKGAVVVRSWKQGITRIEEQELSVLLDDPRNEYEFDIKAAGKNVKYRMRWATVRLSTFGREHMQCWAAELNELSENVGLNGYLLEPTLLSDEGPGFVDNLPSTANFFCPIETQKKWRDGGYLGIFRPRVFEIEHFAVKIVVLKYSYDEKTRTMRSIQFRISISNAEDTR
ncbi:MAG: hypothetical protein IT173_07570 [Acidobacteria bacterium]|nr:hypothetical protein [Acidobacteriota bacterium]